MTRPDIEAILARAEETTPGPWRAAARGNHPDALIVATDGTAKAICMANTARFVAAARTDIPELCAYAVQLERELADQALRFNSWRRLRESAP